jgi:hypothetical protein
MMLYIVMADNEEYNKTFSSYVEAMAWLKTVRHELGCNAGLRGVRL